MGKQVKLFTPWKFAHYDIGDGISRDDLEACSTCSINLGSWKRIGHAEDNQDTIAWESELNIGEACTEFAFRWIVPLYFRADTAKQFAVQRSYAYSGCGLWHVKQNISVVTAMVDATTRSGDGGTVDKYQNKTCSSCGAVGAEDQRLSTSRAVMGPDHNASDWESMREILQGKAYYHMDNGRTYWEPGEMARQKASYEANKAAPQEEEENQIRRVSKILLACEGVDYDTREYKNEETPVPFGKAILSGDIDKDDWKKLAQYVKDKRNDEYSLWTDMLEGFDGFESACSVWSENHGWACSAAGLLGLDDPNDEHFDTIKSMLKNADLDQWKGGNRENRGHDHDLVGFVAKFVRLSEVVGLLLE
ncbi:unnamed protein product [Clonostachys byssicola]|uniref:Uncharacterized protein n=1 Tax=Clonostachys byssicola TaxID=160290 RepID=A0A9N9U835_9HYPO|nr:unnamed protein product [Clonostachys byssicola]